MMTTNTHFDRTARWLHWAMAAMILAMIFVGVGMVASLELRPWLIDLHHPLGLLVPFLEGAIEIRTHRPMPINADGEVTTRTPAHARVVPGAVSVYVP